MASEYIESLLAYEAKGSLVRVAECRSGVGEDLSQGKTFSEVFAMKAFATWSASAELINISIPRQGT